MSGDVHKTTNMCMRASKADKLKLKELADSNGMTMTEYVWFLIRSEYRELKKKEG